MKAISQVLDCQLFAILFSEEPNQGSGVVPATDPNAGGQEKTGEKD